MPARMFARVTVRKTACSETALCELHNTAANRADFGKSSSAYDPPVGDYRECMGNEALSCNVCGLGDGIVRKR